MESKIYKRQITKQSIALRVLDEFQIERYYTKGDLHELYDLEVDENLDSVLPIPSHDSLLAKIFLSHRKFLHSFHEHDSLLENKPEEDLSNEEREIAWQEFLKQQNDEEVKDEMLNVNGNFIQQVNKEEFKIDCNPGEDLSSINNKPVVVVEKKEKKKKLGAKMKKKIKISKD